MASFFNWMPWVAVGDFANVGQLAGINAVQLIAMIVKAANSARMHKKNCRQFAQHLKLISNLLEQLNLTDLKERPECREPLELLEAALRKAVVLVESCRDKSYLYLVAMGWVYVTKFRDYQDEIDKYLKLIPLISLVENSRERLRAIEKDKRLYSMEESEVRVQEALLKPERTKRDSLRLSRQLSRRYPGWPLDLALREENAKLRKELDHMRACMELEECDVIEHLIDFTEAAVADPVILEEAMAELAEEDDREEEERTPKQLQSKSSRRTTKVIKEQSKRHVTHRSHHYKDFLQTKGLCLMVWQGKILPSLPRQPVCTVTTKLKTGITTYSIAALSLAYVLKHFAALVRHSRVLQHLPPMARLDEACHSLAFHSLYGGCYCYTCCTRRKVRTRFNIPGEACSDYWTHACCCCCAVLQEWHELHYQAEQERALEPPPEQEMEGY